MNGDIKIAFQIKAMAEYMQNVIAAMKREIVRRNVRVTDGLLNSMAYHVFAETNGVKGELSFERWGRMVDMGVGRGHPLGGIKATEEALFKEKKGRNPKKIYSPIAYGHLNGLIGDLMYGLTEDVVETIKKELDAKVNAA